MSNGTGPSWLGRNEFLLRRLHSLLGLLPVGAYMVVHLATNASVIAGAGVFQKNVNLIHSLGPALPLVEWTFIFIPLLFHMLLGFVFIWGSQPNTTDYPLSSNVRYTLQRVTGMIAAVFIVFHVLTLHKLGLGQFDPHHATSSAATALQRAPWVPALYVVGITASVFHLANGIWTMGITWGLWISPAAQRRANYVCAAVGVVVLALGLSALGKMLSMNQAEIEAAKAVETHLLTLEQVPGASTGTAHSLSTPSK